MKNIIIALLVIISVFLGCIGYHLNKNKNETVGHISSDIYENISDLNTHIENLKNGLASREAMDREEICVEMAARQIYSDLNVLAVIYPKQEFKLYEIMSNYIHLIDVKIYGFERYRAMELLEQMNMYIAMYSDCDLHSEKGSYHTLIMRDRYVVEQISEVGVEYYNSLNMEIVSLR